MSKLCRIENLLGSAPPFPTPMICTHKQTLQSTNAQLGNTIVLIKCHLEQMKGVFLSIQQREPVNITIAPQQHFFST